MSRFNISRSRDLLKKFKFEDLFVDELGWNQAPFSRPITVSVDESEYTAQPVAELSGIVVFEVTDNDGEIPDSKTRLAVQREIEKQYHEHLLIFLDSDSQRSVWYWVKRDGSKKYPRSNTFLTDQSGDLLLSKISAMFVDMSELDAEGSLPVVEAAQRVKAAFDVERVTKKFYDEFRKVHLQFLESIEGIGDESERRWYSSVILNRLMFIYFLQRKGFVDGGNQDYLQDKLQESQSKGTDRYYEDFLKLLFFEGFAKPADQRSPDAQKILGDIRFLNGGLFLPHHIELKWPEIVIPDSAFEKLYGVFERYSWNLDDTPGGRDDEINPDVLGYIFEKYINQKAFGAYYTRPEITEYLCEQTIHKLVLDKLDVLNEPLPGLPAPPTFESVGDLLLKVDASRAKQLLFPESGGVLPGLSLLDPACGSGAFLVAAMKTLLEIYRGVMGRIPALKDKGLRKWLDQVDRDHPSRDYYIKKRIITDNLFGVDIMAEAVEIARLRLFLALVSSAESVDDLEPLPNIDFNILPGNSLIGLLQVDEGRFDAFVPVSAPKESAEQGSLFPIVKQGSLLALMGAASYKKVVSEKTTMVHQYRHAAEFAGLRENADAVQALRDKIEAHREENKPVLNKILLDEFQGLGIQYEQATWDLKKNKAGKSKKRKLKLADIETLQPFHWGYEFHEEMNEKGGFDAIITNPPWEIWKPQAKEFFAEYADVVQKNNMRIEDFKKKQKELLQNPEVREAWLDYLSRFPHQSAYYRGAIQYQNQSAVVNGRKTGSDINLFKLFTEQCYNLLREGGVCGTVIQSGFYTDLGATGLRQMVFNKSQLKVLFGLSNERWIFDGVHHAQKFCILAFAKGGRTDKFDAAFRINPREAVAPEELFSFLHEDHLTIPIELVKRLSPETMSVMEFGSRMDMEIANKILVFPLLGEEIEEAWQLSFSSEFHMTNHSEVFRTEPCDTCLPLYEGKMIHQFNHDFAEPRYWVDESEGRKVVLGVRNEDNGQNLDYQAYRLGFRGVAASTNERTLICSVIPPTFHGNSIPTVVIFDELGKRIIEDDTQLYVCGVWNSYVLDWLIRQKVTNNLNYFYIFELAIPRLTSQDLFFGPIVNRVSKLICTTPEFDDFAMKVGLGSHDNGVIEPAQRAQLRAELDGLIAHVYGLTEKEFIHILSTFPLVDDEVKEAALREYRNFAPNPEVLALIASGESTRVEFKSSLRWNLQEEQIDKRRITHTVLKTIAAFLNTDGGELLIGVADDGSPVGIEVDRFENDDKFMQHLMQVVSNGMDDLAASLVDPKISKIGDKSICQVSCRRSPEPVFLKWKGMTMEANGDFYYRKGPSSKRLEGEEVERYIQREFPR